jgi:hypothetical protein
MSKDNCPSDEIELVQCLDDLIKAKDIQLALNTLRDVRSTFSRYDEYLRKVGSLIT